jgi:membrane protease YdiL (CAAX protease family)
MLTPYFLLLLCLAVLAVYNFTHDYDSPFGLLLILLITGAVTVRTRLTPQIPSLIYLPPTFLPCAVLTGIITFLSVIVISSQRPDQKKGNVGQLFILYLFFGLMQQLLFQYVFLETINFLSRNTILAIAATTFFFSLFHTQNGRGYYLQTTTIGLLWTIVYVHFGNLLPLVISHGILGTAYYTSEAISRRSQIFRNKLH